MFSFCYPLPFINPNALISFSAFSPRIPLFMAPTQWWWRAPNITWGYVTLSCLTSTHSSTKPTPQERQLCVLFYTSKSFIIWVKFFWCQFTCYFCLIFGIFHILLSSFLEKNIYVNTIIVVLIVLKGTVFFFNDRSFFPPLSFSLFLSCFSACLIEFGLSKIYF